MNIFDGLKAFFLKLCEKQAKHRQNQPKGLRRAGEVRPAVAEGAEEGQIQAGRQEGAALVLGDPQNGPRDQPGGQKSVDQTRQTQRRQVPGATPISGHHRLPKQERRLGVAHIGQVGYQWQPVARRGGEPRDVCVDQFIAIGGHVLAADAQAIHSNGQGEQTDPEVKIGTWPFEFRAVN